MNKYILWWVIIFLIFISGASFIQGEIEGFESDIIPKKIWTFWDGDIPEIITNCINTWKKHNPSYEIIILNKQNLSQYLPEVNFSSMKNIDSPEHFSDMVRVHILAKEGGIWSDSSIICLKPFDWIQELQNKEKSEFVGFYIDSFTIDKYKKKTPVVENWFFACVKGSEFVCDWRDEYLRVTKFENRTKYIEDIKESNVNVQNIPVSEYLAMHLSAQKVLQSNKKYNLSLLKAEDDAFKYLTQNKWDSKKAAENLLDCNNNELKEKANCGFLHGNIIKLRGADRKELEKLNIPNDFFLRY